MISSLTNGLVVSIVQSKWKYTHDNRLGKLLIELVTAKGHKFDKFWHQAI